MMPITAAIRSPLCPAPVSRRMLKETENPSPRRTNPSRLLLPPRQSFQPLRPHFHPYNLRPKPGRTLVSTTLVSDCLGLMGSNSPPVDTIAATSTAATNITPAAMTGAHTLQGAAAANGDQAAAVPTASTSCPLLWRTSPTASAPSASSSRRSGRPAPAAPTVRRSPPPHRPPFRRRPHRPPPAAAPAAAAPPPPPPAAVPPSPPPAAATAAPTADVRRRPHRRRSGGLRGLRRKHVRQPAAGGHPEVPPWHRAARFTKLEFATYDGATDPRTAEPVRGQRTLAPTAHGSPPITYGAPRRLGTTPSSRTRAGCRLGAFPRPCLRRLRGSRLAELGRLAFTTTVQDFADRFQALACHAPGTAMYYARAYEQRVLAMQQVYAQRARPAPAPPDATAPPRPALPSSLLALQTVQAAASAAGAVLQRRVRAGPHVRPPLLLETVDDADVVALTAELAAATVTEAGVTTYAPVDASAFVVSLHAMAGIKTAKTMLLPVTIKGERLTALVDTGSTHNFLSNTAMRRLALQPAGSEKYSVTVANGDRLTCQGVARQVPVLVGDEPFSIDCVGIDLGCYDFILGLDFRAP
ncbi:hypothetical protein QYE76_057892 [Lolium multiflorum]|uniref:Uncharacterized protein n=1 Tax=Lolium multiflorum TaxID=4521 RepID=A0AAD8T4G0_LOLMU|nr:hypothetical protein QYE76_057892 [Lolium multiflorum]